MATNLEIGAAVKTEEFQAGMRRISQSVHGVEDSMKRLALSQKHAAREGEKARLEAEKGLISFGRIGKEAMRYFEGALSLAAISSLIQQMNQILDRLAQNEQQRLRRREEVFQSRGGIEFAQRAGAEISRLRGQARGGEARLIALLDTLSNQLPESEYSDSIIEMLGPLAIATEGMNQSDAAQAATIAAGLLRASGGALTPKQIASIGTDIKRRVGAGAAQITSARARKSIISAASRAGSGAGAQEGALQFAAFMESAASSGDPEAMNALMTDLIDRPMEEVKIHGAAGLTAPRNPRLAALVTERGPIGALHEILTNPEYYDEAMRFLPAESKNRLRVAREKYPTALEHYRAIASRPEQVAAETEAISRAVSPEVVQIERSKARSEKLKEAAAQHALRAAQKEEMIKEAFAPYGVPGEMLGPGIAKLNKMISYSPYSLAFWLEQLWGWQMEMFAVHGLGQMSDAKRADRRARRRSVDITIHTPRGIDAQALE